MTVTVYRIRNEVTGWTYVGSTKNFKNRIREHRHLLKEGDHYSREMQTDYDKYGSESLRFEVIEEITGDSIPKAIQFEYEQKWIDAYKNGGVALYNAQPYAGKTTGRIVTDETRRKLSQAGKGRPMSDKCRDALSVAVKNVILTEAQVREIISRLKSGNESLSQIAKDYNVKATAIWRIKHGRTWKHIPREDVG